MPASISISTTAPGRPRKWTSNNGRRALPSGCLGATHVFTLLGHVFPLLGLILGLGTGLIVGSRAGVPGALLGAVGGGVLGLVCGRLPAAMVLAFFHLYLRRRSSEELRASLRTGECRAVNLLLLELALRGEDIRQELDFVLEMLVSTSYDERCRGWAAMLTAFPELAEKVSDYSPIDTPSDRRAKVERVRVAAAGAASDT
jgi:hypothetical protein